MKRALLILLFLPLFVDAQIITTVAGNGTSGSSGENGPATSAQLADAAGITFDRRGNLYIANSWANYVSKVDINGIITRFAGTGAVGFSGDNGPATAATFYTTNYVAADVNGNIYISDCGNFRIRKVDTFGIITTFAGNGVSGYNGDNIPATSTSIYTPQGLNFDNNGNLFVADYNNYRIRKIDTSGIITTVAGNGIMGYSGDGGPAINAKLKSPTSVVIDPQGNLYIGDFGNNRVRKVNTDGIITTFAGNGIATYSGDNIPSTAAQLTVWALAIDDSNNIFIGDSYNARVRKVYSVTSIIKTIAGTGVAGYNGDGILADTAKLSQPEGLTFDECGNLYISEVTNYRVRKVAYNPNCWAASVQNIIPTNTISIYPNPATIELTIISTDKITIIAITNLVGQTVYTNNYNTTSASLSTSSVQINVVDLPKGIYFVKVNGSEVRKFVKE